VIDQRELHHRATSSADLKSAITPPATPRTLPGVWITGSGTGIQILNNRVHNITTKSEKNGNAFGICLRHVEDSNHAAGHQWQRGLRPEDREQRIRERRWERDHFAITNNLVHDNDNIGIDAIGYEGVGPVGYDEAMYGEISGNTIYNISGIHECR
jgi:hypothetical protein